ncbi:hypothetical protein MtrunA17_Chr1g0192351 [Medicago truncatula]|uniref:Uncharacterized protein n=1 Tax=Medicago truncatula TaxID=3880 RepID=Q2HW49_MEDTR|nr:hypothetical protein MtrDRAFT_AC147963g1v2 [Medicago truncatula]RHN80818.1 hypothetical protein MtrunA17_Chr1g0192351 [Medicago truncatula]
MCFLESKREGSKINRFSSKSPPPPPAAEVLLVVKQPSGSLRLRVVGSSFCMAVVMWEEGGGWADGGGGIDWMVVMAVLTRWCEESLFLEGERGGREKVRKI